MLSDNRGVRIKQVSDNQVSTIMEIIDSPRTRFAQSDGEQTACRVMSSYVEVI